MYVRYTILRLTGSKDEFSVDVITRTDGNIKRKWFDPEIQTGVERHIHRIQTFGCPDGITSLSSTGPKSSKDLELS